MLEKIFIKNYKNTNDMEVRHSYGVLSGIYGIISNALLGVLKIIIGILSNSVSIMADAVNNISDMASSILTIIGFKLTNKKPDKHHPYGHARYEYVFGLIIAIIMIVMGSLFLRESIAKIIKPEDLNISLFTIIILCVSIIVKILQMRLYTRYSIIIKSSTLKTTAIDTRNDIITTSVILLSMIVMKLFSINIDGYLGLCVSLFVIYSAFNALKEVSDPLIGVTPNKKMISKIKNKLLSYDFVLDIHDLIIHNYGVSNDYVTVHIEMDSKLSMIEAHDLIDKIENDFKEDMNMTITIHVDPVILGDKKFNKTKEEILEILRELNKKITIHDFRIIEKKKSVKIMFDCVLPFECNYTYKEIKAHLGNKINYNDKEIDYYIEIDRPYC